MTASVIAHSLDHVAAVYRVAAQTARPIIVYTAPGAAGYAGVLYLKQMCDIAAHRHGPAPVRPIIDCGDDPALVQAAFAEGWPTAMFAGAAAVADKLRAIADRHGGALVTGYDEQPIDLAETERAEQACRDLVAV